MADQNRHAAIEALGTLLKANVVPALAEVYTYPIPTANIPADKFPCIVLLEGPDTISRMVSSEREITLMIGAQILYKDDVQAGRNIDDSVIRETEQMAATVGGALNGTAQNISVLGTGENQPMDWPDRGQIGWRGRILKIIYIQEF